MPDKLKTQAAQTNQAEIIYQSAPSEPDDDFWLEQANKMLVESVAAVRTAASVLMTGLGALQGIYFGMLGFAKFIPDSAELWMKSLFIVPLLCWMTGLYQCLKVAKTEELSIFRHSPASIRERIGELAEKKQQKLNLAYWWMLGGLTAAFLLLTFRIMMLPK